MGRGKEVEREKEGGLIIKCFFFVICRKKNLIEMYRDVGNSFLYYVVFVFLKVDE